MSQVTLTFIVRESSWKSAVNIRVTMNIGQMKYHKAWYAYVPIGSLYPILLFVWVRLDFDLVKRQIAHYSFEIDRVKMSQQTIDCQRLLRRSCTHCQYCNGQCSEPSCDYATMEHNTTGVRGQLLLITTRNSKQTRLKLKSNRCHGSKHSET